MNDNKYREIQDVLNNWATIVAMVEGSGDPYDIDSLHTVCSPEEHARVRQWWAHVSENSQEYTGKQFEQALDHYQDSVRALHQLSSYL